MQPSKSFSDSNMDGDPFFNNDPKDKEEQPYEIISCSKLVADLHDNIKNIAEILEVSEKNCKIAFSENEFFS